MGLDAAGVSVEAALDGVEAHFRSMSNELMDTIAFDDRVQRESEPVSSFLADLRHLYWVSGGCRHCVDDRLFKKVLSGLWNKTIKQTIMARTPRPRTLETLIQVVQAEEAAITDMKKMPSARPASVSLPVEAVSSYQKQRRASSAASFGQA